MAELIDAEEQAVQFLIRQFFQGEALHGVCAYQRLGLGVCPFVGNNSLVLIVVFSHVFYLFSLVVSDFICIFADIIKKDNMTTLQLNAELFRELSVIAEDEGLMKKAVKYLKKLTAQKQAKDETEYIMSSPEMVKIIRQGQKDIEEGRGRVVKLDDLWK